MLTPISYRLGAWTFVPSAHELRSDTTRVRLERRASVVLALMCERRGQVVSHDELIEQAWAGRHVSPNSVAVVIGELRRALRASPGSNGGIETVPKAGYRLLDDAAAGPAGSVRPANLGLIAILVVALLAGTLWVAMLPKTTRVALAPVENAMGTSKHDALVDACSAQLLVQLGRESKQLLIDENRGRRSASADITLIQRWVLWNGNPELVLMAKDRSGITIWSAAIYGPASEFPQKIAREARSFSNRVSRGKGLTSG